MTGSCKCLGWSLNVFPIRTTSHLHVAFIKFFKMQLWVLQAGRHLSIIFYLHFWKIKYQRIWYRKFCLVLWHGFWPHAYIDNWGFSALVEQGSPGMSLHLIVPCEYSHTMVFTVATGCWGFFSKNDLYWQPQLIHRPHNLKFSSTAIVNMRKLLFQVDASNKISFHPFCRCCH